MSTRFTAAPFSKKILRLLRAFLLSIALIGLCASAIPGARAEGGSFREFDRKARRQEPVPVVFFGGSLTWGANAADPQRTSWRALMQHHLQTRYPRTPFTFHDAAAGGAGSKLGLFRLERDVLSRNPSLVFVEFTVDDNVNGQDQAGLAAYEQIIRELVSRKIPVVQVILGFKYNFGPDWDQSRQARVGQHLEIARLYRTAVANVLPPVQIAISEKRFSRDQLWPLDGAHPTEAGYQLFFETIRDAFDKAIESRLESTLAGPVATPFLTPRTRLRLAARPLPPGWAKQGPSRTAFSFDGQPSRWLDEGIVCHARDASVIKPLELEFTGRMVGVLGEASQDGIGFRVVLDGRTLLRRADGPDPDEVWATTTHAYGGGRNFFWHLIADDLSPGRHHLKLIPYIPEGVTTGELRIESICLAGE